MGIQKKFEAPAGIVNASGQPEIVLEIDGLVLSMAPPSSTAPAAATLAAATLADDSAADDSAGESDLPAE